MDAYTFLFNGSPIPRLLNHCTRKRLLDIIEFSDNDYLYVLGDIIDRNCDGDIEMIQ